ncbi:MAG: hypothetical protein JXA20_07025 [Spirochaetes bacterium]|nr:hypothetical protein [Spirochaetota bacterium]
MQLNAEEILDLAQMSFIRLDGAWFIAVAKRFGIQAAWETDVEAWKQLSYIMGKKMRERLEGDPRWPESFLEAMEVFMNILGIRGRSVALEGDTVVVRVVDCDIQKGIAKAGIADCGIATAETYRGMGRGLFGKDTELLVEHRKNLNRGADCCEVAVTMGGPGSGS